MQLDPETKTTVPVITGTTDAEVTSPGRPQRSRAKWEVDGKERLRHALRRFSKPLADALARDANEADTRMIVTDLLREGLGYGNYGDLATEYQIKGEYADYGIRIDKQLEAFVEVKRAATKLSAHHLRQVEMYAVNEGVEWLVLTNGHEWHVYHLTPGLPVVIDLAFRVDLLDTTEPLAKRVDRLFFLHIDSLRRRQIDELWKLQAATAPKKIASVLQSEAVLQAMSRELRRRTKQRVPLVELSRILRETVLRPECLPISESSRPVATGGRAPLQLH